MSFALETVRFKPSGLWVADATNTFTDHSGRAANGSASSTPVRATSVARGAITSSVMNSGCVATLPSTVFSTGRESKPFTLGANVLTISTGSIQILGNTSGQDGLMIDGKTVSFVTKYQTSGECRASYNLDNEQIISIFGVHTSQKNSLYVNGELVAETNLTDAQLNDSYVTTNNNLYSGKTAGTNSIAVNNLSVFPYALPGETISYLSNYSLQRYPGAYSAMQGVELETSLDSSLLFNWMEFSSSEDWRSGELQNASIEDDMLVSPMIAGVPVSGTWETSFALENGSSIFGVYLDWIGENIIIDCSLDGTTWETVVKGKRINLVPSGFNGTSKSLMIRVTFGAVEGFLQSLNIYGLKSGTAAALNSRSITVSNGIYRANGDEMLLDEMSGIRIDSGSVTISTDPAASALRTVEVWFKPIGAGTLSISPAISSVTANGGQSPSDIPSERWQVRHFIYNASVTSQIVLSGSAIIGRIVLYPTTFTSGDSYNVYRKYIMTDYQRISDASVVGVSEPAIATDIYARDWSISLSG